MYLHHLLHFLYTLISKNAPQMQLFATLCPLYCLVHFCYTVPYTFTTLFTTLFGTLFGTLLVHFIGRR